MNILIADGFNWRDEDIERLRGNGENHIFRCKNEQMPIDIPSEEIDVVFCNWFFKYHDIDLFTNLKYVQLFSSGYNGIDAEYAREKGITVQNAKGIYSIPISEFVVLGALMHYKKVRFFMENQRKHRWEKDRQLEEIWNKKVLIIGTGSIGIEVAKKFSAFTKEIYGCNRTVKRYSEFERVIPLEEIDTLISEADIIVLTIALTRETENLLNRERIAKIKRNALIINVSRGNVLDEAALADALQNGEIGGAVLDVFESEPLGATSRLWDLDNVWIIPHNSFASRENEKRLRKIIFDNFDKFKGGIL